jgi:hypothetical protein
MRKRMAFLVLDIFGQATQADFWRRVAHGVAIPLNAGLARTKNLPAFRTNRTPL